MTISSTIETKEKLSKLFLRDAQTIKNNHVYKLPKYFHTCSFEKRSRVEQKGGLPQFVGITSDGLAAMNMHQWLALRGGRRVRIFSFLSYDQLKDHVAGWKRDKSLISKETRKSVVRAFEDAKFALAMGAKPSLSASSILSKEIPAAFRPLPKSVWSMPKPW